MTIKRFYRTCHDNKNGGMKPDHTCFEWPQVTMERLLTLEKIMANEVQELGKLIA